MQRTAKLFMNGRSQAVRLPSEFRFEGDEVGIHRDPQTGAVVLTRKPKSLENFFKMQDAMSQEELDAFEIPRQRTPPRVRKLF